MPDVKMAISTEFLDAFAQVPRSKQSKVRRFMEKFKANPRSGGINYEKIRGAADPNLRSVRIDQEYRGIVLAPEQGNVYLLMWVDKHDEAYAWAENKQVQVHPETGSLQVLSVDSISRSSVAQEPDSEAAPDEEEPTDLFNEFRDRELVRLGVPEELLPLVRSIESEEELDDAQRQLPQEAYEVLFLLAAGSTEREVYNELPYLKESRDVDVDDFATALEQPDSKRRFHVVESDAELERMLDAPLEKWRVFLHPSQRSLVTMEANGPVRVLGGAGTGKTVVAMHRAAWLVRQGFWEKNERLLFTTFTRNLAADIKQNLKAICSQDEFDRIEVTNLDAWVSNFLKQHGYAYKIAYGANLDGFWENAISVAPVDLDFDLAFYQAEWQHVIQSHGITSLAEYMRVSRIGRGIPLQRPERKSVWPVFEEYRAQLDDHQLREREGAMRDARALLEQKGDILPYRSVVVDEAQDMGMQAFKLIRQMIPGGDQKHDVFIVGDAHQRIYERQVVLGHCGINIVGRGRKLRINYRTTEENRRWATALLEGISVDDLDGGEDDQGAYKSLMRGRPPDIVTYETLEDEVAGLTEHLGSLQASGYDLRDVCLIARTKKLLEGYEQALQSSGVATYRVRRSQPEDRSRSGLRLATMHRAKGLEFDCVIVAGVNSDVVPLRWAIEGASDSVEEHRALKRERSLFYVAVTRAKRRVLVTSHGEPSAWIEPSAP